MTYTAYSLHLEGEFDVEQLLRRVLGIPPEAPLDLSAAREQQAVAEAITHLECPSCFARGATIVREGRSGSSGTGRVVRQPHFRFVGEGDRTAHHPLCDFFDNERPNAPRAGGVDFGDSKSALTRAVGRLVCVGIERGEFTQSDMRALRKWNFDLRCEHQFRITRTSDAAKWCKNIIGYRRPDAPRFQPQFGDLPDFNWRAAASAELSAQYPTVAGLFELRRLFGWGEAMERAIALMKRSAGATVFDPTPMEAHYARTIELARFAQSHWEPLQRVRRDITGGDPKSFPILALCALLLSVSQWDLDRAASKLTALIAAPAPQDATLGNIIGLNPFHDVPALRLVKAVQDATSGVTSTFDYEAALKAEVDRLKALHAAYRSMASAGER
ncbi:hypothetical protein [Burkholderia gladioli]|uniref:hypothetical protein n=1 Tax=Burkholderia gladioli TaxID=28095 RepID=UPI001C5EBDCC|nr:hypothetical protein [Burkholderia gladioli]MBW5284220.1 hypothetical protein [Burkholderia gladioli]